MSQDLSSLASMTPIIASYLTKLAEIALSTSKNETVVANNKNTNITNTNTIFTDNTSLSMFPTLSNINIPLNIPQLNNLPNIDVNTDNNNNNESLDNKKAKSISKENKKLNRPSKPEIEELPKSRKRKATAITNNISSNPAIKNCVPLTSLPSTNNETNEKDKHEKGSLRHCSIRICELLSNKQIMPYADLADQIVNEVIGNDETKRTEITRNVQRRIYDARNILIALNIISKDKKDLIWNGWQNQIAEEKVVALETQSNVLTDELKIKLAELENHVLQYIGWSFIIETNKCESKNESNLPARATSSFIKSDRSFLINPNFASAATSPNRLKPESLEKTNISAPFLVLETSAKGTYDINFDDANKTVTLKFSDPFHVYDHNTVVQQIATTIYNKYKESNNSSNIPKPIIEFLNFAREQKFSDLLTPEQSVNKKNRGRPKKFKAVESPAKVTKPDHNVLSIDPDDGVFELSQSTNPLNTRPELLRSMSESMNYSQPTESSNPNTFLSYQDINLSQSQTK